MTEKSEDANTPSEKKQPDLSGRDRLVWNAVVSWVSHLALVVSGFVMPRMIDHFIGQVSLGIWDFCWSFVNYINLVGLGIGASVSRYAAKHRAEGEIHKLQSLVSSVALIQAFMALVAVIMTIAFVYLLPIYYGDALGEETYTTQLVVAVLGAVISVQLFFDSCRGLITGHHRWDIHNALHAGSSVVALVLMISMLLAGQNILGLAIGYAISMIATEFYRAYMAKRVAPDIRFGYRDATKEDSKRAFVFGIKNVAIHLPPFLLVQTVSLVLVRELGPALLAVYSRPLALVKQVLTFMNKFTHMLMPTAGAMGKNQPEELRAFYVAMTKYSMAFTLPALASLVIFGDLVLYVWMGEAYANATLMILLAVGYLLPIAQDVSMRMVIGTNQHGFISAVNLVVVVVLFLAMYWILGARGWTVEAFAWTLVVPLNVVYGVLLPVYACKKLGVGVWAYIKGGLILPTIAALPFLALMCLGRYMFEDQAYWASGALVISAGVALILTYFKFLLSDEPKARLLQKIPGKLRVLFQKI